MTRDAKTIVGKVASAVAAAYLYPPDALIEAATALRAHLFDENEDPVVLAFIDFLEQQAASKNAALQKAFGNP